MAPNTRKFRGGVRRRNEHRRQQHLAEAVDLRDSELMTDLRMAGYTPQTIALVEFAPLVRLAWADGHVSPRQRSAIAQVADRKHLGEGTIAAMRLLRWLECCPSDDVFDVSLSTIRATWERLPLDVCETVQRQFFRDCTAVARGADGVVGDNKIPREEGRVLAKILVSLKPGR